MEIINALVPQLKEGLLTLFSVFGITIIASIPLSIIVAALRMTKNKIISSIMAAYIYIMRGTPLLLQIMFVFFGLPFIPYVNIVLNRYPAIFLAFILNYTAYFAEIFRGGINSIDKGQFEAGKVLGMSRFYTFRKIILPQVLRNVLPALSNEIITLVKDTSLVYIIGVTDILKAARSVSNAKATSMPYLYVGIIYLLIVAVLTKVLRKVEKKYQFGD